jgi:hypothetical protein
MAKRLQACSRLLKLTSWHILTPKSENFHISTLIRTILERLRCGFQVFSIYPEPVFGVAMIFLPLFLHILPQIIISVCYSGQLVTLLCRVTKVMLDQVSTITNNRSILLCVFFCKLSLNSRLSPLPCFAEVSCFQTRLLIKYICGLGAFMVIIY